MKIFGVAGWSGSGKTTLVVALLPELIARGLTVSTMKHAHHGFDIDTPGKDSYEHRRAGATEVMVASGQRWALMHELPDTPEPAMEELVTRMTPVDLLIVEGYKTHKHDKLEVHRPVNGKPLLCRDDERVVAVASDVPLEGLPVPLLDLNDVKAVADFIVGHCGLKTGR